MLSQKSFRFSAPAFATLVAMALAASVAFADGPGLRHRYLMKGSVIESSPETGIYLCIGTADGAAVGQELNVVRISRDRAANPKQGLRFKREEVGRVRIERIVDEHFAEATVVRGGVQKGDQVELEEPERSSEPGAL